MFPRWLPLYLLGIAALTLFPFTPGAATSPGWTMHFWVFDFDFAANVLAFVPIGVALHRSRWWRVLGFAFALSLTIEVCQHWLPRQQDVNDLLANTLGAAAGLVLARAWTRQRPGPLLRSAAIQRGLWVATPLLLAGVFAESLWSPAYDFTNWERYPLVIGNSAGGMHPWTGSVSEIRLYDRDLGVGEGPSSPVDPAEPALWLEGGPILWLHFAEGRASGRIDGPAGPVRVTPDLSRAPAIERSGLRLRPSGLTLERWVSDHVVERLRKSGRVTLDVRLRADSTQQFGPAYIVSLGGGAPRHDLLLAQLGSALVAAIRTPATGRSARRAQPETHARVVTGESQHVRLAYDGVHAVLRVDGACEADSNLVLANAPPLRGTLLGATVVLCTALPTLLVGRATRRTFGVALGVALGVAAGGASWLACWTLGTWDHLGAFTPIAAGLGGLAIAASLPLLVRPR